MVASSRSWRKDLRKSHKVKKNSHYYKHAVNSVEKSDLAKKTLSQNGKQSCKFAKIAEILRCFYWFIRAADLLKKHLSSTGIDGWSACKEVYKEIIKLMSS